MDFYLSPAGLPYIDEVRSIAMQESSEATDALILGYALEAVRLAGTYGVFRQASVADTIAEDDGTVITVRPGDRLHLSFATSGKDANHFPEPEKVNPKRPLDSYIHYGAGPHACLGKDVSQVALTELFRALFRKKGLRKVTGPQGELKKVAQQGGQTAYLTEDWASIWPFPTTMKVTWDA